MNEGRHLSRTYVDGVLSDGPTESTDRICDGVGRIHEEDRRMLMKEGWFQCRRKPRVAQVFVVFNPKTRDCPISPSVAA